jgi:hypothetical protein
MVVFNAKDFVVFKVMLNGFCLIRLAIISKLKDLMLNFFLVVFILFLIILNREQSVLIMFFLNEMEFIDNSLLLINFSSIFTFCRGDEF